jgi:hypothetical protein
MKPGIIKITTHTGKLLIQFTYDIDGRMKSFIDYNNSNDSLFGKGKQTIKLVKELPLPLTEKDIFKWIEYFYNWYKGIGFEMLTPAPEYDPFYRHPKPDAKQTRISGNRKEFRAVDQLTMEGGKLIKTFPSLAVAQKETKIYGYAIKRVLDGKGKQSGGYRWAWNTGSAA